MQLKRLSGEGIYSNSQMKPKHLKKFCQLDAAGQIVLDTRSSHSAFPPAHTTGSSRSPAPSRIWTQKKASAAATSSKPSSTGRWTESFFDRS